MPLRCHRHRPYEDREEVEKEATRKSSGQGSLQDLEKFFQITRESADPHLTFPSSIHVQVCCFYQYSPLTTLAPACPPSPTPGLPEGYADRNDSVDGNSKEAEDRTLSQD